MQQLIEAIIRFLRSLFGGDEESEPKEAATKASQDFAKTYYLKKSVLSKVENAWYGNAIKAIGEDFNICPKVRIEDIIGVQKGLGRSGHASARGRIKPRHFDFVIFNKGMAPIAAVEIDDASHDTEKAKEQDAFKNALCTAVSLPLLRFKSNPTATIIQIESEISKALKC